MGPARTPQVVDGMSRSLWKSLAVKSIRLGWPAGFRRAKEALRSSVNWRDVLLAACFEDLWPSRDQLPGFLAAVDRLDLEWLLAHDTHHGVRQLSGRYAEIAPDVEARLFAERGMAEDWRARARAAGITAWIGPRALSEFVIWATADPPASPERGLDLAPWAGMPPAMADLHTSEGRRAGTRLTILCGHPDGHRWLMAEVAERGWDGVRALVHAEAPLPGELRQEGLFEG